MTMVEMHAPAAVQYAIHKRLIYICFLQPIQPGLAAAIASHLAKSYQVWQVCLFKAEPTCICSLPNRYTEGSSLGINFFGYLFGFQHDWQGMDVKLVLKLML